MNRLPASPLAMKGLELAEKRLGMEELSARLGVPAELIRAWRLGHAEMPHQAFLRLVDVVSALDPGWTQHAKAMTARKRILVVDDHPDSAEALCTMLNVLGHDARALTDPRQAIEVAKAFQPHLALLDLNMPHLSGLELAPMFRDDEQLHAVCLVALTAYGDDKYRRLTRSAGFHAHVVKPADTALLQAIIKQFDG
jgi:CheY-like chemotaxis protein